VPIELSIRTLRLTLSCFRRHAPLFSFWNIAGVDGRICNHCEPADVTHTDYAAVPTVLHQKPPRHRAARCHVAAGQIEGKVPGPSRRRSLSRRVRYSGSRYCGLHSRPRRYARSSCSEYGKARSSLRRRLRSAPAPIAMCSVAGVALRVTGTARMSAIRAAIADSTWASRPPTNVARTVDNHLRRVDAAATHRLGIGLLRRVFASLASVFFPAQHVPIGHRQTKASTSLRSASRPRSASGADRNCSLGS